MIIDEKELVFLLDHSINSLFGGIAKHIDNQITQNYTRIFGKSSNNR